MTGLIPLVFTHVALFVAAEVDRPAVFSAPLNYFEIQTGSAGDQFDLRFQYPFTRTGFAFVMPVAGDWNGDGRDTIGAFDFTADRFHLRDENTPGPDDYVVEFDPGAMQPVAGDWNGDGLDSVGVFIWAQARFLLRNANSTGDPDLDFRFGPANTLPIAGDWDGDGVDTIGVYLAATSEFQLRNSNSRGPADHVFGFGPLNGFPVAGDWDGDGIDTVAVFDPTTNRLLARNSHTSGPPDLIIPVREMRGEWTPLAGKWQVPDPYPALPGYEWEVSTPEAENIDATQLAAAYARARQNVLLNSLLVVRHDRLVAEDYLAGYHRGLAGNVKSVSKSILSSLVGIALRDGHFDSIDQTAASILPELFASQHDPRKFDIALRSVVTMTSGLRWNEGRLGRWFFSPDPHQYVIDQPMLADPDTSFLYSTGLSHLGSCMIERVTGTATPTFAKEQLFDPLGISVQRWDTDPQGNPIGGAEVYLTPRDLLRFGQLYLRRGTLGGREIVPASWVDWSTSELVPPLWVPGGYGFGAWWWRNPFAGYATYFAWGWGGQFIFVVPDLDLVVVATSKWNVTESESLRQASAVFSLLSHFILPAVRPDASREAGLGSFPRGDR